LTATVTVRPRFDACDLEGDPDDTAAGAGAQLVEFCVREDQLEPLPDAPPGFRVLHSDLGDGVEQLGRLDPRRSRTTAIAAIHGPATNHGVTGSSSFTAGK